MAEVLTLTAPVVPPSITNWRVTFLAFDKTNAHIHIGLTGPNGETRRHDYAGTTATTQMIALNKANMSTTSLEKRVLERLVTDGILPAGTVTGSPD